MSNNPEFLDHVEDTVAKQKLVTFALVNVFFKFVALIWVNGN